MKDVKQYTAEDLSKTGLKKHVYNDKFFCSFYDDTLGYPDQKVVEFVPGKIEYFTIEKYKEEFSSEPYSNRRIYLYAAFYPDNFLV